MDIIDEANTFKELFEFVVRDGLKKAKMDITKGKSIDHFFKYPI